MSAEGALTLYVRELSTGAIFYTHRTDCHKGRQAGRLLLGAYLDGPQTQTNEYEPAQLVFMHTVV